MKAKDLMIGKYYQADIEFPKGSLSAKLGFGEDRVFLLTERIANVIYASYNSGTLNLKDFIRPVTLTKDWLLRFEFEYLNEPEEWNDYDESFDSSKIIPHSAIKIERGIPYITSSDGLHLDLPYVHVLQNLYCVHTNKELKATPDLTI